MRPSATLVGVAIAFSAIAVGPFVVAPGYSMVSNAISELGAQSTPNAWVMNAGFVAYGLGVGIDGIGRLRRAPMVGIAFLVFAAAMIMNAVFSHRPMDSALDYDAREDELHSLFATIVGFAFTVGTIAQSFLEHRPWRRAACYGAAAAAVVLPLGMLQFPAVAGLLQRMMFAVSFAWLVVFLPQIKRVGPT